MSKTQNKFNTLGVLQDKNIFNHKKLSLDS